MKTKSFIKALIWSCLVLLFPVVSGVIAGVTKLAAVPTLYLQGGCMALALAVPLLRVLRGKWTLKEIGFDRFHAVGCKKALYFLPVLTIYIPVALAGFQIKSLPYALGCLFLYLFVSVAEEVYFRGIVPHYLGKAFTRRDVILLSAVLFGVGHMATAFTGGGALNTALTVLNAFLFGWLAIETALLSGNIILPILLHFIFDLETKFVVMSGTALALAEGLRGTLMFLIALWLAFVIHKADKAPTAVTEEQRKRKRIRRITAGILCSALILTAGIVLTALSCYGAKQAEKIPSMSFQDCLQYTLDGCDEGIITVGVIRDGEATYTVYGRNGRELPQQKHAYEIGSLTKTFTAALICKGMEDGKIDLNASIDKYLPLPGENRYPTIAQLLTHTSGYRAWYLESPMIGNYFAGRNEFCGITGHMIQSKLKALTVKGQAYPFVYSNFGYAVLGQVLQSVYGEDYTALVQGFAQELGLCSTYISNGKGTLPKGWDWCDNDAYMSAGALVSDIEDMLAYAQLQLDGEGIFGECHRALRQVHASSRSNEGMGIRVDSIGMAWITDQENGIVWHNGGTSSYNCYLGFCPESGMAVVILSNLSPSYRIPATVLGVKLLTE